MKIIEKVKKFYNDHRFACNIVLSCIGVGTVIYVGNKVVSSSSKSVEYPFKYTPKIGIDDEENTMEITEVPVRVNEIKEEKDTIPYWTRGWKEDYRDNWDKVCEFAKTLDLEDGENYSIEFYKEYEEYRKEHGLDKNIVSHMVHGTGVYPPDDNDEGEHNYAQ